MTNPSEKERSPATLQDFVSRGYTEIGRRGNTVYLSCKFGNCIGGYHYSYSVVVLNADGFVLSAVGLVNGKLITVA